MLIATTDSSLVREEEEEEEEEEEGWLHLPGLDPLMPFLSFLLPTSLLTLSFSFTKLLAFDQYLTMGTVQQERVR